MHFHSLFKFQIFKFQIFEFKFLDLYSKFHFSPEENLFGFGWGGGWFGLGRGGVRRIIPPPWGDTSGSGSHQTQVPYHYTGSFPLAPNNQMCGAKICQPMRVPNMSKGPFIKFSPRHMCSN